MSNNYNRLMFWLRSISLLLLISSVVVSQPCDMNVDEQVCRDAQCQESGGYCQAYMDLQTRTWRCECKKEIVEKEIVEEYTPLPSQCEWSQELGICVNNGGGCFGQDGCCVQTSTTRTGGNPCTCQKCSSISLPNPCEWSWELGKCVNNGGCPGTGQCCGQSQTSRTGLPQCYCQECSSPPLASPCQWSNELGTCVNNGGCSGTGQCCVHTSTSITGENQCTCQQCPPAILPSPCKWSKEHKKCLSVYCDIAGKCCRPYTDASGQTQCGCISFTSAQPCQLQLDGTCHNHNCSSTKSSCCKLSQDKRSCQCTESCPPPPACQWSNELGTCVNNGGCSGTGQCCVHTSTSITGENQCTCQQCPPAILPSPCKWSKEHKKCLSVYCDIAGKCCRPYTDASGQTQCGCISFTSAQPCQLQLDGTCHNHNCSSTKSSCCKLSQDKRSCQCTESCPPPPACQWSNELGTCVNNGGCSGTGQCCVHTSTSITGENQCTCQQCPPAILPSPCKWSKEHKKCLSVYCDIAGKCCRPYTDASGQTQCGCISFTSAQPCQLQLDGTCHNHNCSSTKSSCCKLSQDKRSCQCTESCPPPPACQWSNELGTCVNNGCTKGRCCQPYIDASRQIQCICTSCIPVLSACLLLPNGTCHNNGCSGMSSCCQLSFDKKSCLCTFCSRIVNPFDATLGV